MNGIVRLIACGIIHLALFGCTSTPPTDAYVQTNAANNETEQRRIDADVENARVEAESKYLAATIAATAEAEKQAAITQRNLDTQTFLSDRFAWEERGKTERWQIAWSTVLQLVLILCTAFLVSYGLWVQYGRTQAHEVTIMLPPVPSNLSAVNAAAFFDRADRDDWDGWGTIEDEYGNDVGYRQLPTGQTQMWLLEDKNG